MQCLIKRIKGGKHVSSKPNNPTSYGVIITSTRLKFQTLSDLKPMIYNYKLSTFNPKSYIVIVMNRIAI